MSRPLDAGAKRYKHNGRALTLREWSDELDIPRQTLVARLRRGWTIERALSQSSAPPTLTAHGRTHTVREWSEETGVPKRTILDRVARGVSAEDAVATYT